MVDTIGTQLDVLYRDGVPNSEVDCTQLYVVGTADSVLIERCPLFRVSFIERFHCTTIAMLCIHKKGHICMCQC